MPIFASEVTPTPGSGEPPADEYAWAAPVYDPATAWALAPLRRELAALVGDTLQIVRGVSSHSNSTAPVFSVLDVCCGTGRQCRIFEEGGLHALGVDLSPAMLAKARPQFRRSALLRGDAASLPFAGGVFPCATIALALHEKPPGVREAIFLEMLRVTRSGGLVLVADYLVPAGWSRRLLGLGIKGVERLAGQEHHACYAGWMRGGGLSGFLTHMGVSPVEIRPRMFGLLGIACIRRP